MTPDALFQSLWQDYIQRLCPSAETIHQLLTEEQALINDHIALRTFAIDPIRIDTLAKPFLDLGYEQAGEYEFVSKKLYARHYEHPDPLQPKVFISELKVNECSEQLQAIVKSLVDQLDVNHFASSDFLYSGTSWSLSHDDYLLLAKESEYAGWLAAHGFGANHFTVSVNQLNRFEEVSDVNTHLRDAGFTINESGGEVKGSPEVLLEQSSTMADKVSVEFINGSETIPGGFYEFAKRYPMADGDLYQGFVAASADKIFESTDGDR
ncbi:DUF1338 domain-containing protein [Vibrio tapetis]|uniref:2-oxoadipate dioxygenase/decarboxylase n=1 Tax=Vibrio tapetis subsp. tapetis TaxID=1671868 RepID=A0A2N8ZGC5_9VIBR|nr:DUF1338 domain-containing protein [Vibrio tapetis]SON50915.1 conserved protein of unknown function [Vibrio tapetis subsp. tapetis]